VSHLQARLEDGVDALLVPPGDTAALVAALVRLRDDPGGRAEMGTAARRSAAREWSWDRQVRRTLDRLGITA
jgi:glycosyltransferase involved in cell wall biosynthesis